MARTKAQKLNAKRGRPRLAATSYEQTGRKSRRKASSEMRQAMTEQEARSVVVQRRIREGEIIPFREKGGKVVTAQEQAENPMRGYVLGLMTLDHTLTTRQHEAGLRFAEDMVRYYGLTGVQFPSARAQNLFAVHGSGGEDSESRSLAASAARTKANKLRDCLLATGSIDQGRRVIHCLMEVALLDNAQARKWPEHMLLWTRQGLNRLADYYGIETS